MIAPSGEQVELALGDQRAVVVGVGGGLRSYVVAGRDVIDGYAVDELCRSGRGQVLIPWPNRIEDGAYTFDGRHHQLPLSEPGTHNAIHGLVRWSVWTVAERAPHRVVMEHLLHPQPGYPHALELRVEYALAGDGLHVRTTATNVGPEACPFGSGAHPYLTLGVDPIDSLVLSVPSGIVLRENERGIPLGPERVDGTEYDFRRPAPIGRARLDHCFTDLDRDRSGAARVTLLDPAAGRELALWADASYRYFMVFTGDSLPDVDRRSVAVEPMTCAPNAFRSGDGLVRLEPGTSFTGTWGIAAKPVLSSASA